MSQSGNPNSETALSTERTAEKPQLKPSRLNAFAATVSLFLISFIALSLVMDGLVGSIDYFLHVSRQVNIAIMTAVTFGCLLVCLRFSWHVWQVEMGKSPQE